MSSRDKVAVTVGLCFLVAVLEGFDIQAMGVAAPRLAPQFGLDASQMGWVFSISNIGLVIGASFGGWLADRTGRKPVLMGAVADVRSASPSPRRLPATITRCSRYAFSRAWVSARPCPT